MAGTMSNAATLAAKKQKAAADQAKKRDDAKTLQDKHKSAEFAKVEANKDLKKLIDLVVKENYEEDQKKNARFAMLEVWELAKKLQETENQEKEAAIADAKRKEVDTIVEKATKDAAAFVAANKSIPEAIKAVADSVAAAGASVVDVTAAAKVAAKAFEALDKDLANIDTVAQTAFDNAVQAKEAAPAKAKTDAATAAKEALAADKSIPDSVKQAAATAAGAAGADAEAVKTAAIAAAGADASVKATIAKVVDEALEKKKASADAPVVDGAPAASANASAPPKVADMLSERITAIDEIISGRLDAILHDINFKELEATWRGLHKLVDNTETSSRLKLRVLNVDRKELQNDLEKAIDFDQSALFKKIYEEEYGTFGGFPFSVLMADFKFGRRAADIVMLTKLSNVAAAAHAPLITAADPALFDMDNFTELALPRDLSKIFEGDDAIKWRAFRDSDDARYVSLVLPHVLLRLPYGDKSLPAEGLNYEENVFEGRGGKLDKLGDNKKAYLCGIANHANYLWGNAAYALAQRITNAFALYGWCAAIRGVEGGGAVTNLPIFNYPTESAGKLKSLQCPTELTITDRREKELNDLGFIALCHKKNADLAVFFGGQTAAKPKKYNRDAASANARISAQLPYVLAASRFAHYIKVIMRDKIGSFATKDNVERYLNNWIADYVLVNDDAPQSIKAQYPLREARVDVVAMAGKPGCYRATVFLKPHFQLEELTTSIRLVAELPLPAAA